MSISLDQLAGYKAGSNRAWLEGTGSNKTRRRAEAYLIPGELLRMPGDPRWDDVDRLLAYARKYGRKR